ncbi:hypothetical protein D6D25_05908 [Aureobasidium pullulans]|nr:hypothetical protein D6D25_05908 [Aureobasidium pullulans]
MDRRRVCDACSVRRVKCDGQAPCGACTKSSVDCTRLRQRVKSGPKGVRKKTLERLKTVKRQNSGEASILRSRELEHHNNELSFDNIEESAATAGSSAYPDVQREIHESGFCFPDTPGSSQRPATDLPHMLVWPYRMSLALLKPYLDIYHFKLYPVWPVVNKDALLTRLHNLAPDVNAYMLASSICAATMLQLQLSVLNMDGDVLDPSMPELDTESQPYVLSAFIMLCRMFRSFSDASSGARLTADDLTLFNNQLLRIPTLTEHHNDLQKADLSVTQQWLRLMFWKLAINKVIMTANTNDDIRSVFFPISLAKDLLTNISAMSIDTLEAHGPGMELKLFEVTNSVADMISLNPRQTTSALEIGPQDILVHLATIIGRFRGGNKTLLPLLQSRLSGIGLDSLILPRITDVTYDSPDTNREKSSIDSNEVLADHSLYNDSTVFSATRATFDEHC